MLMANFVEFNLQNLHILTGIH